MIKYSLLEKKKLLIILLLCFLSLPWANVDRNFDSYAAEVRQESVAFYEVNPCRVSLSEFLLSNPNSIYQDHYHFTVNNYSAINCYGRIAGVTVIDSDFYIAIGANSLINLIIQGSFWIFMFTRIKKNDNFKNLNFQNKSLNIKHYFALILTTIIYSFSIFAELRFYEKSLYFFRFDEIFYKLLIFFILFFLFNNLLESLKYRSHRLISYSPYLYLLYSVFSVFNFTFFSSIAIYYGIISFFENNQINIFNKILFFTSLWWIFSSRGSFYFNPGKFRGFTSSVYEFNATIFWCVYFILIINGLWYIYKKNIEYFNFQIFINNMSITSITLLLLGLLGANLPIFNFFNYYYFGLQKFGIERNNPFEINAWAEKISWRGFYASAESVGEFFALAIFLVIYSYYKKKKINYFEKIGFIASLFGLYFSDNRTAAILIIFFSVYLFLKTSKIKKSIAYSIFTALFFLLFTVIGLNNFTYSYEFLSTKLYNQANYFQYDSIYSSFMIWLNQGEITRGFFFVLFEIFSTVAYFINRSEMWGLFFARYNPTFFELLIGSGPLNLGQVYGEIVVTQTDSFLLPHSSFLSSVVYFGLLGTFLLLLLAFKKYLQNKENISTFGKMVLIFILINIFKNDVLNYFSSFVMYITLLIMILNSKNDKIFNLHKAL